MKVVAEISREENREVQELIEKKYALKNLGELLIEKKQYGELYKRCSDELTDVNRAYNQWWDGVIMKYQLSCFNIKNLLVDCTKQEIYSGE